MRHRHGHPKSHDFFWVRNVQRMHQFTPLAELARMGPKPLLELLRKYSEYSGHVQRKVYCDPNLKKQQEVEEAWPEYAESQLMVSRPHYQRDAGMPSFFQTKDPIVKTIRYFVLVEKGALCVH